MIKRILAVALACLLFLPQAVAEDFFTIDIDLLDMDSLNSDAYVARELSASTQGIRVCKYISDSSELAAPVRLTLIQMDSQTLLFDRDYGLQSGTFDSGVIYLPYVDSRTIPYLVTLYVGDYVYAMPFMHLQRRLEQNSACTRGVRLSDLDGRLGGDWLMGTMVDLDQLRRSGSLSVDVCASNQYVIGRADVFLDGERLRVDVSFDASANVSVHSMTLYVTADCAAYLSGSRPAFSTGEWVDVGSASSALIYLPMQVSYDPSGLPSFRYDGGSADVQAQKQLWDASCGASRTPSTSNEEAPSWDDGWSTYGWSDGWSDGWNDSGWDDGWSSGADGWSDGW